eukprot:31453-Pelagococcus_subviridis.AAC.2
MAFTTPTRPYGDRCDTRTRPRRSSASNSIARAAAVAFAAVAISAIAAPTPGHSTAPSPTPSSPSRNASTASAASRASPAILLRRSTACVAAATRWPNASSSARSAVTPATWTLRRALGRDAVAASTSSGGARRDSTCGRGRERRERADAETRRQLLYFASVEGWAGSCWRGRSVDGSRSHLRRRFRVDVRDGLDREQRRGRGGDGDRV